MSNTNKVYKPNNSNANLLMAAASLILFVGVIALCMVFIASNDATNKISFRNNSFFFMALGIGLFFLSRKLKSPFTYILGNDAITITGKNGSAKTIYFKNIEDEITFSLSNNKGFSLLHLCFRQTAADQWYLIGPSTKKYLELINNFKEAYIKYRFQEVLKITDSGRDAVFLKKSSGKKILALTAKEMPQYYTDKVLVNSKRILLEGKSFDFSSIRSIAVPNGEIVAYNKSGDQLFSLAYEKIGSADLFVETVKHYLNR